MPKLKTNKAIRKRFKLTAKRKVVGLKGKRRHLLTDRSPSKKRHLRKKWIMGSVDAKTVIQSLPYS